MDSIWTEGMTLPHFATLEGEVKTFGQVKKTLEQMRRGGIMDFPAIPPIGIIWFPILRKCYMTMPS